LGGDSQPERRRRNVPKIVWIFAAIALGGAACASVVENMRTATLSLWIVGLALGGVYLTLGAETLAVIQWIVCTLAAISFIFFAAMFGEYDVEGSSEKKSLSWGERFRAVDRAQVAAIGLAAIIGVAFVAVVRIGSADLPESSLEIPKEANDLLAFGHILTTHHLLSLEVLAMTLLLILVGGGVIARPEPREPDDAENEAVVAARAEDPEAPC
jgi:NADH:ubiquinone oxidoreductase subunit 6 (subunit J)